MLKKILVANRGEISVRVIRACREMGILSAAVFCDVDRAALHVLLADEAYSIGAAAAAEPYLNINKILQVPKRCPAGSNHQYYGLLFANRTLARARPRPGLKVSA